MSQIHVSTTINGDPVEYLCEPDETLLDVLRDRLGLTGSKEGCASGDCGACSVMVDGRLVCACLVLAAEVEDKSVETIEGMADGEQLHPIQEAFIACSGFQCGFCTPGMILTTKALLAENPQPSEDEIKHYMRGNICRCTGYKRILESIKDAARRLAEEAAHGA